MAILLLFQIMASTLGFWIKPVKTGKKYSWNIYRSVKGNNTKLARLD